ncbi:MAG: nucleoside-diphosphate sugar epimerase/dehydratase [Pseudomonadota bacterium]
MPRRGKRFLLLGLDVIALTLVVCGAHALIIQSWPNQSYLGWFSAYFALVVLPATRLLRFYKSIVRFVGVDLVSAVWRMALVMTIGAFAITFWQFGALDALRLACVVFLASCFWLAGSRFFGRLFMNKRGRHRESVIIYGAGEGGIRLAASLSNSHRFFPVAFVDDNPAMRSSRIDGLEVFRPADIAELVENTSAKRILLALPSAPRSERKRILDRLEPLAIRVQTIPDVGDLISGKMRVDDVRDVAVEDLLGRDPVPPERNLLEQENRGRVVLVTGAGGSIGSELCRLVLKLRPTKLILVERSELGLYNIEKELHAEIRKEDLSVDVIAFLASVQDEQRMKAIFAKYKVDTVYHAAAYKHVPIVEHNVFEGIDNNTFGTLATARAAIEANVKRFVLVSTDKAVSPTNVMGASKRLAEMVLQSLAATKPATVFCMVRFGNVLASSGSVVPLFREQIRSGGPVTVTHPEITRYFMTIPEAAQLVIQAGALANGGEVFVLDMGEPVKIIDLAVRMIHLMGLEVMTDSADGDVEIVFSGLRPAEKLYEELLIGSSVSGTPHPRIMQASEQFPSEDRLRDVLESLRAAMKTSDFAALRNILLETVEGYQPTGPIEDLLLSDRGPDASSGKVAQIERYRQ